MRGFCDHFDDLRFKHSRTKQLIFSCRVWIMFRYLLFRVKFWSVGCWIDSETTLWITGFQTGSGQALSFYEGSTNPIRFAAPFCFNCAHLGRKDHHVFGHIRHMLPTTYANRQHIQLTSKQLLPHFAVLSRENWLWGIAALLRRPSVPTPSGSRWVIYHHYH